MKIQDGATPRAEPVNIKLEVVMIGVTDIDRAKEFYQRLGWRFDGDFTVGDDFRVVQMTPHNSGASIIFGKGIRSASPGLADSLVLAVDDLDAARQELLARGVDVSEVFHYAGGPFNDTGENPRVGGRDPEGRSYFSFASFEDPDGNPVGACERVDRGERGGRAAQGRRALLQIPWAPSVGGDGAKAAMPSLK